MSEPEKNTNDSLASEMYHDQKQTNKFLRIMIVCMFVLLALTIGGLIGTHIYHIHQWSLFDNVVVDSGEGSGNANYVQGDNTGGIYNGEGSSTSPEIGDVERNQNPSS